MRELVEELGETWTSQNSTGIKSFPSFAFEPVSITLTFCAWNYGLHWQAVKVDWDIKNSKIYFHEISPICTKMGSQNIIPKQGPRQQLWSESLSMDQNGEHILKVIYHPSASL